MEANITGANEGLGGNALFVFELMTTFPLDATRLKIACEFWLSLDHTPST